MQAHLEPLVVPGSRQMPPRAVDLRDGPFPVPGVVGGVEPQHAPVPPEPDLPVARRLAAVGERDHGPPFLDMFVIRPFEFHPERNRPLPQVEIPFRAIGQRALVACIHAHRPASPPRGVRKPARHDRIRIAARRLGRGRTVEIGMEDQFGRMLGQSRTVGIQFPLRRGPRAVVAEEAIAELHDVVPEGKPSELLGRACQLRQDAPTPPHAAGTA